MKTRGEFRWKSYPREWDGGALQNTNEGEHECHCNCNAEGLHCSWVCLRNPLKIRADQASVSWVSSHRWSTAMSLMSSSAMDGVRLSNWIPSDVSLILVSSFGLMVERAKTCRYLYTHGAPVLPHHCWRPCPFLAAVTQLCWGNFDLLIPLHRSVILQYRRKFSDLFFILCPQVSVLHVKILSAEIKHNPTQATNFCRVCVQYVLSRRDLCWSEPDRSAGDYPARTDTAQVKLFHGWLSRTHFNPGYPSWQRSGHFGISMAQSKGCNYNPSNGIISQSFATRSGFFFYFFA